MRSTPWPWLVFLTACATAPAWQVAPADLPTHWRDHRLFVGRHAWILAPDEAAAAAVRPLTDELGGALAESLGHDPRPALWIALDRGAPLPLADAAAYLAKVPEWCRAAGRPAPPTLSTTFQSPEMKQPLQLDPALVARLLTVIVPEEEPDLALPPELVRAAAFVAIVPTDACLADAAARFTDQALAAAEIPAWKVAAASLLYAHPATLMQRELTTARRIVLGESWLQALEVAAEPAAAARERMRLPARIVTEVVPMSPADELALAATIGKVTVAPPDDSGLVVGARPDPVLYEVFARHAWGAVVEIGVRPDAAFGRVVHAAGKDYEGIECRVLPPDRAAAERLEAVRRAHPGLRVFVCADDVELAAALVALHGFHCRGLSPQQTLALARHYGAGAYLSLVQDAVAAK
jgi:hypothetical protein